MYLVGYYHPEHVGKTHYPNGERLLNGSAVIAGISDAKNAAAAIHEIAPAPGHYFAFEVTVAEVGLSVKL
jgi:hypothetical protein